MQVGLDLAKLFYNVGIIDSYAVIQKAKNVHGASRLWPLSGQMLSSSAEAQGCPGMFLQLKIKHDRFKPLYNPPDGLKAFVSPVTVHHPIPDNIDVMSKPSVQRHMSLQQLLSLRRNRPPGIFLVSSSKGLVTDIEAERLGVGGVVLGWVGLPLAHVAALQAAINAKFAEEGGAQGRHEGLMHWDLRKQLEQRVTPRLEKSYQEQKYELVEAMKAVEEGAQQVLQQAREAAQQLQLQESVWYHRNQIQAEVEKRGRSRDEHVGFAADRDRQGLESMGGSTIGRRRKGP
jgi:hypothetical protein